MKDTLILETRDVNRDIDNIKRAAQILKNGGVVAIPTETVYGLAADAFNEDAVRSIFEAKGRPQDNPLIVHISSFDEIYSLCQEVPPEAKKLCDKFWPGPLTIILKKRSDVPLTTSGGLDTVAVRMPSNEIANKIIGLSCPLAAPSANISGFPSPTLFDHVEADMMGRVDAICSGGECAVGVESTVITLATEKPMLLRPGGITREQLESVLGEIDVSDAILNPMKNDEAAPSPGMKYKHYSPNAAITIARGSLDEFVAFAKNNPSYDSVLCFEGQEHYFEGKTVVTYGKENEPLSQTKRLFTALRELDEKGAKNVIALSPKRDGIGLAVCNRLYRAAAFRIINCFTRPIVGLTGPTGAGKGYVSQYLKSIGCFVSDTDKIARELTAPGSPFLKILADSFGEDILAQGELNRKLLADRAFKTKEGRELLNSLMHPEIIRISHEQCLHALENGALAAVIDAPLLFEAGADKLCDCIISVTAPLEVRTQRIMARDNITIEQAMTRINAQHEDDFYNLRADYVVKSYEPHIIENELKEFVSKYNLGV